MNENIDLTNILKDCPEGWKFWSPLFGEVKFSSMGSDYVDVEIHNEEIWTFNTNATITFSNCESLELMLFPSKDQRDWSKFKAPWYKMEKFDPKTLKPFDKVIVRDDQNNLWNIDFYSSRNKNNIYQYRCIGDIYRCCIPYNEDTKHLIGTKDEAPEYYRYWED